MKKKYLMKIAERQLGGSHPVFVVAEISANHGQNFKRAVDLIRKAKECGADGVKFQIFTPDSLTLDCRNKYFWIKHPRWGGQTLHQLYSRASMPWSWVKKLKRISDDLGLVFFCTSYDKTSVDFLEEVGVPVHKVASQELVDLPFVEYIAKTKKPIIFSTGMATVSEIRDALAIARKAGVREVALLKCVSTYPARPSEMNLNTIFDMYERFQCLIGISDHTLDITTPVTAVALGAKLVERHFTFSRKVKTVDSFFSTEPDELKKMIQNIRVVESSLGRIHYGPTESEKESKIYRRSLFVVEDIEKSEIFTEKNVRSIRPAMGLSPKYLNRILGKKARQKIRRGQPLDWKFIER